MAIKAFQSPMRHDLFKFKGLDQKQRLAHIEDMESKFLEAQRRLFSELITLDAEATAKTLASGPKLDTAADD